MPQPRRFLLTPYGWGWVGVALLALLPMARVLGGTPVWDDEGILSGKTIAGGESLVRALTEPFNHGYYRPFVSASFVLDRMLFGAKPFFHHQTNLLIHVLTALVLVAVGRGISGSRKIGLLAGALFAVQGVQVSATAWIGGRTDSLCALFLALMALALVRGRVGMACLAYLAAMMTKEQALLLGPLIPLGVWALQATPDLGKVKRSVGGALLTAVAFALLWLAMRPDAFRPGSVGLMDRVHMAGTSLAHYAILLLFPGPDRLHTLTLVDYGKGFLWPLLGWGILALALGAVWRWGRTDRPLAWCLAWVLLAALPVANLVPMPSLLVGPYRVAIAGVGLAVGLALLFRRLLARWGNPAWAVAGAYLLLGTFVATQAAGSWSSNEAWFSAVARHDPASLVARLNLAAVAKRRADFDSAEREITRMLDDLYGPGRWRPVSRAGADPLVLQRIRENQGARTDAEEVLSRILWNYGDIRSSRNDRAEAEAAFRAAERVNPRNAEAIVDVGLLHAETHPEEADRRAQAALRIQPDLTRAAVHLARRAAERRDFSSAGRWYEQAAEGTDWLGDLWIEAAFAYARAGRGDDARRMLRRAEKSVIDRARLEDVRREVTSASDRLSSEPGSVRGSDPR